MDFNIEKRKMLMSGQAKALRVVKKKINGFRSGVVAAAVVAVVVAVVVVALRIAWAVKNVIVKKKRKKKEPKPKRSHGRPFQRHLRRR